MSSIFTGTAAELWDLVKPFVDEEWWPKDPTGGACHLVGFSQENETWWSAQMGGCYPVPLESAASIIFAAAMVHLAEKGLKPLCDTHDTGTPEWRVASGSCVRRSCIAPSPLHAVLAAVSTIGTQTPAAPPIDKSAPVKNTLSWAYIDGKGSVRNSE